MAQFYSDQINFQRGNPALGGLQGSPNMIRNVEAGGGLQIWRFSYTQAATGGPVAGDVMDLAYLDVTARMYGIFLYSTAAIASGAISIGRVDPNNPANNNATLYVNAFALSGLTPTAQAVMIGPSQQVGADNRGDQSVGNTAPPFGAARNIIQATIGTAPPAGTVVTGWLEYVEGNQA